MRTLKWILISGLLIGLMLTAASSASAAPLAVCVSTGTGNWGDAIWTCGGGPTASDIVIVNDGHTVTLNTNASVYQLIVGGGTSGILSHDSNGTRTLTVGAGGLTVSTGGAFTTPLNQLTVNGNTTINGTLNANGTVDLNGDLSNSGTLNAGSALVQITGNATLGASFVAGTSTLEFNGTGAQGLNTTSPLNNLTVNKSSNNVTLGNNATVNGTLALTQGDLDTTTNTLTMGASATTTGNYDVLGTVRRASPTSGVKSYGSQFTTLDFSSAVTSDVIVTMSKQAPAGLGTKYVKRKYTLTVPGGNTATVRLHYRSVDLNDPPVNEANLYLYRYDSVNGYWVGLPPTTRVTGTADSNYIEKTGVSTFSEWAISSEASPTAVRLNDFAARANESNDWIIFALGGVIGLIALGGMWRLRK
ncbi:MAG: hypothetical protein HZC40_19885 [Chloroflexi bacterium]|nr:hypothetical protein [Chloroflexota bacterium]